MSDERSAAHGPRLGGVVDCSTVGSDAALAQDARAGCARSRARWWNAQAIVVSTSVPVACGPSASTRRLHRDRLQDRGGPSRPALRGVRRRGLRREWLPDAELRERTATRPKSARFDWGSDGTRVVVGFEAKADGKSLAALAHEKLPDAAEAERMKAFWRERVAALKEVLEA